MPALANYLISSVAQSPRRMTSMLSTLPVRITDQPTLAAPPVTQRCTPDSNARRVFLPFCLPLVLPLAAHRHFTYTAFSSSSSYRTNHLFVSPSPTTTCPFSLMTSLMVFLTHNYITIRHRHSHTRAPTLMQLFIMCVLFFIVVIYFSPHFPPSLVYVSVEFIFY